MSGFCACSWFISCVNYRVDFVLYTTESSILSLFSYMAYVFVDLIGNPSQAMHSIAKFPLVHSVCCAGQGFCLENRNSTLDVLRFFPKVGNRIGSNVEWTIVPHSRISVVRVSSSLGTIRLVKGFLQDHYPWYGQTSHR